MSSSRLSLRKSETLFDVRSAARDLWQVRGLSPMAGRCRRRLPAPRSLTTRRESQPTNALLVDFACPAAARTTSGWALRPPPSRSRPRARPVRRLQRIAKLTADRAQARRRHARNPPARHARPAHKKAQDQLSPLRRSPLHHSNARLGVPLAGRHPPRSVHVEASARPPESLDTSGRFNRVELQHDLGAGHLAGRSTRQEGAAAATGLSTSHRVTRT
jgi:hypothetical protein